MSSKKKNSGDVRIQVKGIRYEEFAKIKWALFLRLFSVVVMLVAVVFIVYVGKTAVELPLAAALAVILVVLAVLAVYRSGIRQEYKRAGLAGAELTYSFDRDGWTVCQGSSKVTVLWKNTLKMKRNQNALLLYPNKKSVNIVPLRCMTGEELEKIIGFCTGKTSV